MNKIEIYTDGSCYPNPNGNGGYSFVVVENEEEIHSYGRGTKLTTNNRMEMQAIIDALYFCKQENILEEVTIYTDSRYCASGYKNWMYRWKQSNWKNNNVLNQDLWEELYELRGAKIVWVKGHDNNKWNDKADELADYKRYI